MAPALITFESPELYRLHNAAGFWGPVTSSVDWCEHNYEVAYYVAEFFNCFSNLAIVAAGLLGLRNALRHGYPRRVLVLYTAITVIGLGSAAFHGTLTRQRPAG